MQKRGRPEKTLKETVESALKRFKVLVTYFDITRPQYERTFQENGRFSKDKFCSVMAFVSNWKRNYNKAQAKKFADYSSALNYTLDIPSELVKKILGGFRDANGKWHKMPITKIEDYLLKTGWLKEVSCAGKKVSGGKVKYWWHKKYIMSDNVWRGMIDRPEYSDYTKYPGFKNDKDVQKAVKIIAAWFKAIRPEKKLPVNDAEKKENAASTAPSDPKNTFMWRVAEEWSRELIDQSGAYGYVRSSGLFKPTEIDKVVGIIGSKLVWRSKLKRLVRKGLLTIEQVLAEFHKHGIDNDESLKEWYNNNYNKGE